MKIRIKNIATTFNWIVFFYSSFILLLMILGKITFGYGLGDLAYFFGISIMTLIYLVLIIIFNREKYKENKTKINFIIGVIFLTLSVFLTYSFTIGRGVEYSWDGNVFTN